MQVFNSEDLKEMLKRNLRIKIRNGDFVNPNDRIIEIVFDDEVITSTTFDVVQKREYEG